MEVGVGIGLAAEVEAEAVTAEAETGKGDPALVEEHLPFVHSTKKMSSAGYSIDAISLLERSGNKICNRKKSEKIQIRSGDNEWTRKRKRNRQTHTLQRKQKRQNPAHVPSPASPALLVYALPVPVRRAYASHSTCG